MYVSVCVILSMTINIFSYEKCLQNSRQSDANTKSIQSVIAFVKNTEECTLRPSSSTAESARLRRLCCKCSRTKTYLTSIDDANNSQRTIIFYFWQENVAFCDIVCCV